LVSSVSVVSAQIREPFSPAHIDIPADSRFFGKPL
jgi:hypothetical protein